MTQTSAPTPPKSEKQNQHFIPRWWLKAFADRGGNIWALQGDQVQVVGAGSVMSADWIYTLFDSWWRPSDAVEDGLSKIEGTASRLFRNIEASGAAGDEDWSALLWFIALTACRHPTTMDRSVELSKELGVFLSEVKTYPDGAAFETAFESRFGSKPPVDMHPILSSLPQRTIDGSILKLLELQPYDPSMPQTDALLATDDVAAVMRSMDCRLLTAPAGAYYVLGDRPLPAKDVAHGFTIPLSKTLALEASPGSSSTGARSSAEATADEIEASNLAQVQRAERTVIGPDREALRSLAPPPEKKVKR
ncbi:DUF4238 domain-containing protein [Brevundimonas sp.]|uniref:DUF4238 domain-containing protein n=1 Tax=Brevundimonas sp. TaxID=1871086 RepID=UPI001A2D2090|nr:DUF4238 domain-containing protein [Brevundimonas sp.]MBJ7484188.1 DUF4238 domain-containing protein [Brevundimonas sp.]